MSSGEKVLFELSTAATAVTAAGRAGVSSRDPCLLMQDTSSALPLVLGGGVGGGGGPSYLGDTVITGRFARVVWSQ